MMLEVSGYEVHDLGIDVPVESFVAAITRARRRRSSGSPACSRSPSTR